MVTIGRDKEPKRSSSQFESFFSMLKDSTPDGQRLKVGILQKDKNEGPMIEEWASFFSTKVDDYDTLDVASSISSLLAVKDSQELVLSNVLIFS